MLATQHPSDDELKLYLLDRLPGRKSVRIAEHLLLCPSCVELSAELEDWIYCVRHEISRIQLFSHRQCVAPVQARLAPPARPAARLSWQIGYGVAAVLVLSIGIGTLLFQQRSNSTPSTVALAVAPVLPAQSVQPASQFVDPVMPRFIVRKRRAIKTKSKPYVVASRYFVAPPGRGQISEPEYLLPPEDPVMSIDDVTIAGLVALPTDIGQLPAWTVTSPRRNLFLRFLAALVKPFRSDRI
jgi:hypothetical protein